MKELLGWSFDGALDPWSCFYFSPLAEIYVISHFDNISAFCFKNKMPLYANLEYFYTVFDICTFTQYPALHFDLFLL